MISWGPTDDSLNVVDILAEKMHTADGTDT